MFFSVDYNISPDSDNPFNVMLFLYYYYIIVFCTTIIRFPLFLKFGDDIKANISKSFEYLQSLAGNGNPKGQQVSDFSTEFFFWGIDITKNCFIHNYFIQNYALIALRFRSWIGANNDNMFIVF